MVPFKKSPSQSNFFKDVAPYLNLGWQLTITILVMVAIGWLIDNWLGSKPIFLVVFSFLGCAIGLFDFIRSVMKKR